jgi:hypothetical protein
MAGFTPKFVFTPKIAGALMRIEAANQIRLKVTIRLKDVNF